MDRLTIFTITIFLASLIACDSHRQDNSPAKSIEIVEYGEAMDTTTKSPTANSGVEVNVAFPKAQTQVAHPTKRALVIGIGQYEDGTWSKIHGDLDVPIVQKMLNDVGYADIKTLTNNQATKAAIVEAFGQLSSSCGKGDIVYVHFSGHGQQITDLNGDEDDGWDEAWIPFDAKMAYSESYRGEKHLTDDEVAKWLTLIKSKIGEQGRMLVVVDACHSGDSSRDIADEGVCIRGAKDGFVIPIDTAPKKISKVDECWITLTACKDFQVNCEVRTAEGKYFGMLSYALYNFVEDLVAVDNKKFMMLLQRFVNKYRSKLPQDATLSGETETHCLTDFFKR